MVTADDVRELLKYDPETGSFTWRARRGALKAGSRAGTVFTAPSGKRYIRIKIDGASLYAHRLAWLYVHGADPAGEIDHISGNGLDNRLENLRDVPRSENAKNLRGSGLFGLMPRPNGKWQARIQSAGKQVYLGQFNNLVDAIIERKLAEIDFGFHANHGL